MSKVFDNIKKSLGCLLFTNLGFVHEHTRPDRDDFISINEENIEKGSEGNFRKRVLGDSNFFEKDSVNSRNSPYDVLSLLHYGPQDFSKNGEDVFTFLHDLPDDEIWPEPDPEDPLSIVDEVSMLMTISNFTSLRIYPLLMISVQVELSLAYKCEVSQESLLKYIHFNRHHNTLLIEHTVKMVKENRRLINDNKQATFPVQCKNYNVLDSPARHFQTTDQTLCHGTDCCDQLGRLDINSDWKGTGWYRVAGSAGFKLIESPVPTYSSCGTDYNGWLDGGHPSPGEGELARTVHFNSGKNPKHRSYSVKVINCNNEYFVYYLPDLGYCAYAYCTE